MLERNRFDEAIEFMALGADIAPDALSSMLFPLNNQPDLSLAKIFARHLRVDLDRVRPQQRESGR